MEKKKKKLEREGLRESAQTVTTFPIYRHRRRLILVKTQEALIHM